MNKVGDSRSPWFNPIEEGENPLGCLMNAPRTMDSRERIIDMACRLVGKITA